MFLKSSKIWLFLNLFFLENIWHIRVMILTTPRRIKYIPIDDCFLFCCRNDLENRLKKVTTSDILLHPNKILSLIVPCVIQNRQNPGVNTATLLRKVAIDYRYSLLRFKTLNNQNLRKKYSYIHGKNLRVGSNTGETELALTRAQTRCIQHGNRVVYKWGIELAELCII